MSKKKKLTEEEKTRALELLEIVKTNDVDALKEKLSLQEIILVRKYISCKIKSLSLTKKVYFANDDFANYDKCKEQILKLKNYHKVLGVLKDNLLEEIQPLEKNNSLDKKNIAIRNILMLDFYLSSYDEELFNNYLKSNHYLEKMQYLTKLREVYIRATYNLYRKKKKIVEKTYKVVAFENGLDGGIKKNKKEFSFLLDFPSYSNLKKKITLVNEKYVKSKRFLEELEKIIKCEAKEYDNSIPKKYLEIDDTNYEEIIGDSFIDSNIFIKRLENIRDGKYIRKYGLALENFIPKEIIALFEKLENLNCEVLEEVSNLAIDVLKNKLRILKKGKNSYDDVERQFLKMLIKKFEDLKPREEITWEKDTSIYYDIINELALNDNNFSYIEKLINEIPNVKDARKDNLHIIINLLDYFILNYKLKLANQGFSYIEPNFYKEIIKTFYKNDVVLTEREKEIIEERLSAFMDYATQRKYVSLKDISNDVNEIRKNSVDKNKTDVNYDKLEQELKFLDFYKEDVTNGYKRKFPLYVDGDKSSVFMIEGIDNCCFSVDYGNSENITLGIHFLDTSKFIESDSEIIKSALEGKEFLPKLNLKEYEPVISFTYQFIGFRHFTDLRFSPGVVFVDKVYNENDLDSEKEDLKNMFMFVNNFRDNGDICNIRDGSNIKEILFKTISDDLKKKFSSFNIPFIYEKQVEEAEDLIRINHNAVCDKLSKIPRDEAHKIFEIMDKTIDKYYVPNLDQLSSINLDTSTFLGYYLASVLGKLQKNKYDIDDEAENLKLYLEKLNSQRIYLPANIVKSNESKLKRMVRIYKKK